jgi:GNAT superfamily N-acetyltransferase
MSSELDEQELGDVDVTDETTEAAEPAETQGGITVRALDKGDFFAWYALFAGYAEFYETPLPDDRAMRAWAWLTGDESAVRGLVAVDQLGAVVGLAHVQQFERLKGVATALINHLKEEARDRGFGVIRWITADDNATARKLYDQVAEKTRWVTYDLNLG